MGQKKKVPIEDEYGETKLSMLQLSRQLLGTTTTITTTTTTIIIIIIKRT